MAQVKYSERNPRRVDGYEELRNRVRYLMETLSMRRGVFLVSDWGRPVQSVGICMPIGSQTIGYDFSVDMSLDDWEEEVESQMRRAGKTFIFVEHLS